MAKDKSEQLQPQLDPAAPKEGEEQNPPEGAGMAAPQPKKAPAGHVLLAAPAGTTSAGVGGTSYVVPKNGVIPIKEEHADTLIRLHGFRKA